MKVLKWSILFVAVILAGCTKSDTHSLQQAAEKAVSESLDEAPAAETAAAFDQEELFEGTWTSVPPAALGMQFLFGGGEISSSAMVFSGNKCSLGVLEGALGSGGRVEWEGTFKVNKKKKEISFTDDFGDTERYRYTFTETEDDIVLKLKSGDEITTWYRSKPEPSN